MPYKNYQEFIEYLKYLNNTERILYAIYEYFRDYVSYNYDQLQAGKLGNGDGKLDEIKQYALTIEPTEASKQDLLQKLDAEFMNLEGRPVTPKNRELFFRNYGKKVHFKEIPEETKILFGKPAIIPGRPARDEVINKINVEIRYDSTGYTHLVNGGYPTKFYNVDGESTGMLQDAVCADYSIWMNKICNDVGIISFIVNGKGTTRHAWNAIYIPEKDKWVNFDMTMVKFYQDGWIKEHGEYKEEDWIYASTKNMFEMQPTREIYSISQDTINRETVQISKEGKSITISLANNNIAELESKLNEILQSRGISKK